EQHGRVDPEEQRGADQQEEPETADPAAAPHPAAAARQAETARKREPPTAETAGTAPAVLDVRASPARPPAHRLDARPVRRANQATSVHRQARPAPPGAGGATRLARGAGSEAFVGLPPGAKPMATVKRTGRT